MNKVKDLKTIPSLTESRPRIHWHFSSKGEKARRHTEEMI